MLVLAHTTCADAEAAERLARGLVEARIAACVSIGAAVLSVYPWQEGIETASEVPLLIKTAPHQVAALKRYLADHHDYEVPELLVTPVIDGLESYLQWAADWINNV